MMLQYAKIGFYFRLEEMEIFEQINLKEYFDIYDH